MVFAMVSAETDCPLPQSSIQDFCEAWEKEVIDWTHGVPLTQELIHKLGFEIQDGRA